MTADTIGHKKPKQARSIKTREKIIETGTQLFCTVGYHATSSKKIAREAGIATGSFYNHFKDKKELLLEIHALHSKKVHAELKRVLQINSNQAELIDGRKLMRNVVDVILKTHSFSPELHREINSLSNMDSDFEKMNRKEKKQAHKKLTDTLKPYLSQMRIKDLDAAYYVIGYAIEAVVHSIVMSKPPIATTRLTAALADMLHRYLFHE